MESHVGNKNSRRINKRTNNDDDDDKKYDKVRVKIINKFSRTFKTAEGPNNEPEIDTKTLGNTMKEILVPMKTC